MVTHWKLSRTHKSPWPKTSSINFGSTSFTDSHRPCSIFGIDTSTIIRGIGPLCCLSSLKLLQSLKLSPGWWVKESACYLLYISTRTTETNKTLCGWCFSMFFTFIACVCWWWLFCGLVQLSLFTASKPSLGYNATTYEAISFTTR